MAREDPHNEIHRGVFLALKAVDASPSGLADIEADAWDAIRAGLKLARRSKTLHVFDGWRKDEMTAVLQTLVGRSNKKPLLKSQAVEILATLLSRSAWLSASRADPFLDASVQKLSMWKERLNEGRGDSQGLVQTAMPVTAYTSVPATLQGRSAEVSEYALGCHVARFREGVQVMQEHHWQFPLGQTRAQAFDGATEAFEKVHQVTKYLAHARGDSSCGELECFSQYWADIMVFLKSLYDGRPLYRSRVRFVAAKLATLSTSFRRAFDEASALSADWPVSHRGTDEDVVASDAFTWGSSLPQLDESSSRRDLAPALSSGHSTVQHLENLAVLPRRTVRGDRVAVAMDDFVYVSGGFVYCPASATAKRVDLSVSRWHALLSMPNGRYMCTAVADRGVTYVLGGTDNGTRVVAVVAPYPIVRLGIPPSMPKACANGSAIVPTVSLYVFGGAVARGLKYRNISDSLGDDSDGDTIHESADDSPRTRHAMLRIAGLLVALLRRSPLCGPCLRATRQ